MSVDFEHLNKEVIDRVIAMAWEDRTPFEAIEFQFNLTEKDVIKLMRANMLPKSFRRWRKRVQGRATKHQFKRGESVNRFKSNAQRTISLNKPSKPK